MKKLKRQTKTPPPPDVFGHESRFLSAIPKTISPLKQRNQRIAKSRRLSTQDWRHALVEFIVILQKHSGKTMKCYSIDQQFGRDPNPPWEYFGI